MKKYSCWICFYIVLGILIFSALPLKAKTQNNQIDHGKNIRYSSIFFFQHLNSTTHPNIHIDQSIKNQYEFLNLPINWHKPKGMKYSMAMYHANKNFHNVDEVLLFVLGGPGDHISYMKPYADKMYKALGKKWDVIIWDQRGCGLSVFKLNGKLVDFKYLTMSQTIGDIRALIKLLRKRGMKKIVLAGGSSGAIVALKYGIEYSGSIDMLYIDGGAASANFVNLSNKLAIEKISKKLYPETIKDIAAYYGIDKDVLFECLWWELARDPMFKKSIWYDLKNKNANGKKALKKYINNSIIIPPFKNKKKLLDSLVSLWRLYYIGNLEIIPKPKDQKTYQYNLFKSYNIILAPLVKNYHLKWQPFNFKKELSKITIKTIITNGLDDSMVPFAASKEIYKKMNNNKAILLGFKKTGHGALTGHSYFIMQLIKTYLNNSKKAVRSIIANNKEAVLFGINQK